MRRRGIPTETLMELRNSLDKLPPRSKERRILVEETAELYGVSTATIYRALKEYITPKSVRRTDYGQPRVMPKQTLLRYCEIIAALKVRTSNGQGRHLSTVQAIRLLEEHGINIEDGHLQAPTGLLKKTTEGFPFQGIPKMLYMDNGPISRSRVFQKVMNYLGVEVRTHLPKGSDGRRVTARAKGKVERPFRTVKEMHETLYHLHEPETITEANTWLMQFLLHYNKQSHRRESHSRIEDWLDNLSREGIREMCSWERFCTFAREPEQRKVGIDARVTVDGVAYEVEPDLAGEKVILWWGLFDSELYVEYQETRHGPYAPIGKPIPLHSYRSFKKTNTQKRSDRIEALAKQLALPDSATGAVKLPVVRDNLIPFPVQSFVDPDPFEELEFKNAIAAKVAIADYLFLPLAKLTPEQMAAVEEILSKTLNKKEVMGEIKDYFSR